MTAADRLRALATAATPGPWFACSWDPMEWPHVSRTEGEHHPNGDIAQRTRAQDAAYIAALQPAVALAVADLIDAGETHYKVCAQADDCYCWLCGEEWPCPTAKALAHLEELLPPLELDLDGLPFCPTGLAQRYHDIGECDCG